MKHLIAAGVGIVALSFGVDGLAKGNGNNSSNSGAAPSHHSSSSSAASGTAQHYSGGGSSYRAMNVYRNGNRSLVYPRVSSNSYPRFSRTSVGHQFHSNQFQSSANKFSSSGGY